MLVPDITIFERVEELKMILLECCCRKIVVDDPCDMMWPLGRSGFCILDEWRTGHIGRIGEKDSDKAVFGALLHPANRALVATRVVYLAIPVPIKHGWIRRANSTAESLKRKA
jgi:predicted NAD-dependent protein-ADP-ribosyltransferase YbiA (DUF1768 family)